MLPAGNSVTGLCCSGDQIYDLAYGVAVKKKKEAFAPTLVHTQNMQGKHRSDFAHQSSHRELRRINLEQKGATFVKNATSALRRRAELVLVGPSKHQLPWARINE